MVTDNSIFREKVRCEKRYAFLNENFDFNPKNLINVTEKLTQRDVTPLKQAGESLMDIKTKLGSLTQIPRAKF